MKKILLLITLFIFSLSFSQVNYKHVQDYTGSNNAIITNTNNSQLGGDEVILWEYDFSDQTMPNITVENIGGYGDWIWSTESTQGQYGTGAGLIESPTVSNGFMIVDADWFNTFPNNDVGVGEGPNGTDDPSATGTNPINASFTIGPIDLSSSETNALVLEFYSYYRKCCNQPGNGDDLNIYVGTPDQGSEFQYLDQAAADCVAPYINTFSGLESYSPIGLDENEEEIDNEPNTSELYDPNCGVPTNAIDSSIENIDDNSPDETFYPNVENPNYSETAGQTVWNDLNYIEGDTYEVNQGTNIMSQVPLGSFDVNVNNVYFKFEWIGTHYFWMIDDISIIQQPPYDLKMFTSWLVMDDPEYLEYYSIPKSQMPETMYFGGEIYNYGYNYEENISVTGEIIGEGLTSTGYANMPSDTIMYIDTEPFDISSLNPGTYTFETIVQSNGNDVLIEDNSLTREFVISENEYKIDGLYENISMLGTGFPYGDNANGLMLANYFDIKEATTATSARIRLYKEPLNTSNGSFQTTSGGEVVFYLCDTASLENSSTNPITSSGIIWESDYIMVKEWMVEEGFVSVEIPDIELQPNAYYLVAELWSNDLDNEIFVIDDKTVAQPGSASMFFSLDDDQWYSNPNALAIHLGINGLNYADINEENILTGMEIFPNPTNTLINISSNSLLKGETVISVYNILGDLIQNYNFNNFGLFKSINIENIPSGNYILEISNNEKLFHEKIVKK